MRKLAWLLLLLPAILMPLPASYTLDNLIASMEINNTDLRKADQAIVQSELDVKDAKAAYHPAIDLTLTGMYMPNPLIDDIVVNTNDILTQLGRPPLMQGYDIKLYDGMESTYYNASISITQPLITWGKITNSVKLYETVSDAMRIQRSDKEKQLIAELKARLAALYYIDEAMDLLDETIETSGRLVSLARSGEEEGAVLSSDVIDAEIQARQAELSKKELEGERISLIEALRTLTGIKDLSPEDISYIPSEDDVSFILSYPMETRIGFATSPSSPSLVMASKATEAAEYGKKIADASMYGIPDIALQLSASYGGPRFPFIEKNWSGKDDWNLMITVALKTTLWDGGKILNNRDRIESQIESSRIDYDAAVNALESAVVNAYTSLDISLSKVRYQELRIDNEKRKAEDEEMKKELGVASDEGMLSSRLSILEEELDLVTERMMMFQNCYTLYYLSGIDPDRPPVITDGMAE